MTFDYDIQYKPGRENVTADCLSHLPLQSSGLVLEDDMEVVMLTSTLMAKSADEFKAAGTASPMYCKLRDLLMTKWPKSPKSLGSDLLPYYRIQHELSLQEDCMIRGTHRLLVPEIFCVRSSSPWLMIHIKA